MSKIKVYQKSYQYSYEGGHNGDETITNTETDTYVEVLNIKKCFNRDGYMHKAREWVNKTFGEEEYSRLHALIKDQEREIKKAQEAIKEANSILATFLVDVEIVNE